MDNSRIKELAGIQLNEGTIGPFWPSPVKLKQARQLLNYPADVIMSPPVWEVILAALADKLTFLELDQLDNEIITRLEKKDKK